MSFFLGFATGAAKAVDKSLQESISRTRDNIDMMSKFRLKRAAEAEEKRKKDGKELEDLLTYGAGVIDSSNNPEAVRIAASLYEEKGDAGFRSFISDIENKKRDTNVSPYAFFIDAEKSDKAKDLFSVSDYVNYFLDSAEQYGQPDQAVFQGIQRGGGLLEAITGPIDIAEESARRTPIETTARDLKPVTFGKYVFQNEDYKVYNMTPNERVTHFRNKTLKPGISDEERTKAEQKLEEALTVARENGDLETQKEAIEISLRRTEVGTEEHTNLTEQLSEVNNTLKRNAAAGNPLELKKLNLLDIANQLAENPNNFELRQEFNKLNDEITDLEKGSPGGEVLADRLQRDIDLKKLNKKDYIGSQEEEEDKQQLLEFKYMEEVKPEAIERAFNQIYSAARKTIVTTGKFADALRINPTTKEIEFIGTEEARQFVIEQYKKVYDTLTTGTGADKRAYDKAFQLLTGQLPKVSKKSDASQITGSVLSQTDTMLSQELAGEEGPEEDNYVQDGQIAVESKPEMFSDDASSITTVISTINDAVTKGTIAEQNKQTAIEQFAVGAGGIDLVEKIKNINTTLNVIENRVSPATNAEKTRFDKVETFDKVKMAELIRNTQTNLSKQGLSADQPGQNNIYFRQLGDIIKTELQDVYNLNDARATEITNQIINDLNVTREQEVRQELEQLSDSELRNPASFKFSNLKQRIAEEILRERRGQPDPELEQRRSEIAQEEAQLQALIDAGDYESMTQQQLDRIVGDPRQPVDVIKKANEVRVTLTPQKIKDASNEQLLNVIETGMFMNRTVSKEIEKAVEDELNKRASTGV